MAKKSSGKVSELKSHIGYHLRVVSNAVSQSFTKKLEVSEVTVAEWVILREMYSANEKTYPSIVAEMTGLTRGAVSKLIERLINKDLVLREEAADDRRYQEIKLSKRANKLVPKLTQIADENDDHFFSILSEGEKRNLLNVLTKLARHHELNTTPVE